MGFPPGITSPRDNPLERKLFLVETPYGCHICFIIPNKYKTQKGEKHQIFWINTRRLPCWTSFASRSLGKLLRCSGIILRARVNYSTNSWLLPRNFQLFHELLRATTCHQGVRKSWRLIHGPWPTIIKNLHVRYNKRYYLAGTLNFPSSCPCLIYLADVHCIYKSNVAFIDQENVTR